MWYFNSMEKVDVTIIGSGVVGLACAYSFSGSEKRILVLERNKTFGQETSSRNSEVIHAGLYYTKNSLKVLTCLRGNKLLYELCLRHNIPHKRLGKLVIASDQAEAGKIDKIYANAVECGVEGLRPLDKNEIKRIEPDVSAERGFLSPDTGIIDSHALMKFFYDYSRNRNVDFAFSVEAIGIEKLPDESYNITVREPAGEAFSFNSRAVINSAGLMSDKVAQLAGMDINTCGYTLSYCKGEYFRVADTGKFSIKRLIYPPPTSASLGIHVTPDLVRGLRLGPDAEYTREIDYSVDEKKKEVFFLPCESLSRPWNFPT